jgi:hypothetical protein
MVSSLETCIIYCIALVWDACFLLMIAGNNRLASKSMYEPASTTTSACRSVFGSASAAVSSCAVSVCSAKNSDSLSLLLNLYQLVVGCFSALQLFRKENSGVLASLSCLCKLIVGQSYKSLSNVKVGLQRRSMRKASLLDWTLRAYRFVRYREDLHRQLCSPVIRRIQAFWHRYRARTD